MEKAELKLALGNITNSLKGLNPSLFRGFVPLPVPSSLRLCGKTSLEEH